MSSAGISAGINEGNRWNFEKRWHFRDRVLLKLKGEWATRLILGYKPSLKCYVETQSANSRPISSNQAEGPRPYDSEFADSPKQKGHSSVAHYYNTEVSKNRIVSIAALTLH